MLILDDPNQHLHAFGGDRLHLVAGDMVP
jgi:hypothetical protein